MDLLICQMSIQKVIAVLLKPRNSVADCAYQLGICWLLGESVFGHTGECAAQADFFPESSKRALDHGTACRKMQGDLLINTAHTAPQSVGREHAQLTGFCKVTEAA